MTGRPRSRESRQSIWERPEPLQRPAPVTLNREEIVRAAMAIADEQGLAGVSLRKVAAVLGAGPMRFYTYLSTKQELFELMADAVYGEMTLPAAERGNWREVLRAMAHETCRVARRRRWFVELLAGRPRQGPSALAHQEAALAAFDGAPGFESIDDVLQAVRTISAYVIGALTSEFGESLAELESGLTKSDWQTASGPYPPPRCRRPLPGAGEGRPGCRPSPARRRFRFRPHDRFGRYRGTLRALAPAPRIRPTRQRSNETISF